ncbi:permease [Legionella birminghamensis]|uniref:Probable membrane transporter protein n=1 Tax=Legionella birminghamensis TaxID=28083 RepID=A0A378ID71_9GAMM|nr:sulfite exporter TauE/SafE family protein [Legionella birminghamensis]KTC68870.1 permease [Legionella birminghamensis]STX33188.1 permease [Legionella birminghamensis]
MSNILLFNGLAYSLTGIFAGLMAGLLGIGGGIIVVPALLFLFEQNPLITNELAPHLAVGSSLAVMVFSSLAAIWAHHQRANVSWPLFNHVWPGLATGVMLAAAIARILPAYWLKALLGIFLVGAAIRMRSGLPSRTQGSFPAAWINHSFSLFTGFISGLLGIGGGLIIVPYLAYCGVDIKKIAGISALCTLTVGAIGCIAFTIAGYTDTQLPSGACGYVYWPAVLPIAVSSILFAPAGVSLNYRLPVKQLNYIFIFMLIVTAVHLLWDFF